MVDSRWMELRRLKASSFFSSSLQARQQRSRRGGRVPSPINSSLPAASPSSEATTETHHEPGNML